MKKRQLRIAALLVALAGLLSACDIFEECGTCKYIQEDGGGNRTEGTPLPFCGETLAEKQDQLPVTVGDITSYWECY